MNDDEDKKGEPGYSSFQYTDEEWSELKDVLEDMDMYGIMLDLSFMYEEEVIPPIH